MSACALCGTPAPPPYRAPAQEGAPDLDGRPGEPTRSTLRRWVLCCRGCQACAPDLAALPASNAPIVESDGYRSLTSPFLRWAALVHGAPAEADALLQAAWDAEDQGQDATSLRRRAAEAWPAPTDAEAALRLSDIQRRAGMLAEAAATLERVPPGQDAAAAQIASFERARIAAGDTGRHLLSSALRPPARTPHVAHGKRKAGFWTRFLGGRP